MLFQAMIHDLKKHKDQQRCVSATSLFDRVAKNVKLEAIQCGDQWLKRDLTIATKRR